MEVGKDTGDIIGLGIGGNMMVEGEGGKSIFDSLRCGRSESASLRDAEGPFGTSVKGTRDMKPGAWRGGKACGRANTHWLERRPKRPPK